MPLEENHSMVAHEATLAPHSYLPALVQLLSDWAPRSGGCTCTLWLFEWIKWTFEYTFFLITEITHGYCTNFFYLLHGLCISCSFFLGPS